MRFTNLSGVECIKKAVTASGTPERLSPEYTSDTIAFVSGGAVTPAVEDTITDTGSEFVSQGFRAGDILVITGTVSNNIEVEIKTVAAGTITLTCKGRLTDEVAGTAFTLTSKKGIPIPDGVGVIVKASTANTNMVYLASTAAKALKTNTDYFSGIILDADQSVTVQVKNLNSLWIDADTNGEGVEIMFEA